MRLYNKRVNPFGKHKLTFKPLSLILSDMPCVTLYRKGTFKPKQGENL